MAYDVSTDVFYKQDELDHGEARKDERVGVLHLHEGALWPHFAVAVAKDLSSDPEFGKIEWVDPTLNDSQKDAIRFALASREIALIHGPPGVR